MSEHCECSSVSRLPVVSYDWLARGTWTRNAYTVMSVNYNWWSETQSRFGSRLGLGASKSSTAHCQQAIPVNMSAGRRHGTYYESVNWPVTTTLFVGLRLHLRRNFLPRQVAENGDAVTTFVQAFLHCLPQSFALVRRPPDPRWRRHHHHNTDAWERNRQVGQLSHQLYEWYGQ